MSENYQVVKDMKLLRALEKLGIVKFCSQTGTKICGLYGKKSFTCFYIDEAPYKFEYNDRTFGQKYFDGCFYPYLVEYFNK